MKELTYGSVCSGIEAVSVAWDGLNLKPIWFSEIEPNAQTRRATWQSATVWQFRSCGGLGRGCVEYERRNSRNPDRRSRHGYRAIRNPERGGTSKRISERTN